MDCHKITLKNKKKKEKKKEDSYKYALSECAGLYESIIIEMAVSNEQIMVIQLSQDPLIQPA